MKNGVMIGLLALLLLHASAPSRADQFNCCLGPSLRGLYVGAGLNHTTVAYDALQETTTGNGFNVIFGWRIVDRISLDFTIDGLIDHPETKATTDIYYPPDTAEYSALRYGIKFDFLDLAAETWTPWIEVGQGFAFLLWDTYFYNHTGSDLFLALGVDKEFSPGWILRARFTTMGVRMEDDYGHPGSRLRDDTYSLSLVYESGRGGAPTALPRP